MKLVWNGKMLKHVESGVEAESVEELVEIPGFVDWFCKSGQLTVANYFDSGLLQVVHGPTGNMFIDESLENAAKRFLANVDWLKNQIVHAYDFEVSLEGVQHKPSNSLARSWGDLVQRFSYREWFYEYLPDCEWVRNTWTLHHKPTGIKVCSHDLWGAIYDLMGNSLYVDWLKGGGKMLKHVCEWKAERANDGWVNVTHEPTGMSISSMFDVRDCVETITGSKKYVDWVCDQVEFEEDDLCILWVSGWYLHVPTGKTGETLEGLMRNIYTYLCGSKEFVQEYGCVRHKGTGLILTSDAFLKYLEDRVHDKTTPLA